MTGALDAISSLVTPPATPARRDGNAVVESFEQQLRSASPSAAQEQARQAAEQLVSIAFIEPALKMMRENTLAAGPFAPGDTERRFAPMLDQMFSERVTTGSNFPLVDRLEKQLTSRIPPAPSPPRAEGVNIIG